MDNINFSDVYVEQVLKEIKDSFSKKIFIDDNNKSLMYSDPFFKTDQKMRSVLKGLLFPSENGKTGFLDNNYLSLQNSDSATARKNLRISLILYYTALFFDNVELLMRLIKEGVNFGDDPDDLLLCVLDKNVSSTFNDSKYPETVKRGYGFFEPCYSSLLDSDRDKYLAKFARILEKREDIVFRNKKVNMFPSILLSKNSESENNDFGDDREIFTREKLAIIDEETYMKASLDQLRIVIANTSGFRDAKNILRLNNLILKNNFSSPLVKYGDKIFNSFTDEEILGMTIKTADNFIKYYKDDMDLSRIKGLYKQKPALGEYRVLYDVIFLNLLTDSELLGFTDSLLEDFSYYIANLDGTSFSNSEKEKHFRTLLQQWGYASEGARYEIEVIKNKPSAFQKVKALLGMNTEG